MKSTYKILLAEKSSGDKASIMHSLKNANFDFQCKHADTLEQFENALTVFSPDVIICDEYLPELSALSAMKALERSGSEIPFILVTDTLSDPEAIEYLTKGIYDYILRPNLIKLPFSIKNAVKSRELESAKRNAESEHLRVSRSIQADREKNKDITDSIIYAKEIQNALMPGQNYIHKYFPESFLINMPKHIVSGDFYWFSEYNGKYIVAVGDCTGHGVPGALISMMGYNKLDHIVNVSGITSPSEILSGLNAGISSTFRRERGGSAIQDGMDIALCVIDPQSNTIEFSGANRPLYYISNNELRILKGDKKCIGGRWSRKDETYTKHSFRLDSITSLYLFTDGILDQFGGEQGKKFLSKRFNKLLPLLQSFSMENQRNILVNTLNEWKGDHEQTDDICMLGIKF